MDALPRSLCFFSFLLLFPVMAQADVYRCSAADGSALFSDKPCADGESQPLVLVENSPLDSATERENIARYRKQPAGRSSRRASPRVVILEDSYAEERNARLSAKPVRAKKKKTGKIKTVKTKRKKSG